MKSFATGAIAGVVIKNEQAAEPADGNIPQGPLTMIMKIMLLATIAGFVVPMVASRRARDEIGSTAFRARRREEIVDPFDPMSRPFWDVIGVAILCGAIVGLERQLRGKPAGVRTSILVCLGTAIFVSLGSSIVSEGSDATRVLGQLVTGIGFLGAGVMFSNQGVVSGVTTAAVIWLLAAIGAAVGFGHYQAAIALAIVTDAVLVGVEILESSFKWLTRGAHKRDED